MTIWQWILLFTWLHMLCIPFKHECFIFPCLAAPCPPFPPPPEPSFFPICSLSGHGRFRFSFERNFSSCLLASPFLLHSLYSLPNWEFFLHFCCQRRKPNLSLTHSLTTMSVPWWRLPGSLCSSPLSLRLYCSGLLTGLCASHRPFPKMLPRSFKNIDLIISSQDFFFF